jgi:nicotinamide mononucleotide transporter
MRRVVCDATELETIPSVIWHGLTTASWLDRVNLVLGIAGVWLMTRRILWAFPIGMIAVAVQGVLFFQARFYADAALQIFFFVTLAWGWQHWVRHRGTAPELPVTTLTWRSRGLCVLAVTVTTVVWALILQRWTNAVMPWRDAAIAALQVAGQVLQARKKLENWPLFTAANLIAIPAYWSAELAYTAFLFAIYLVLGLVGWHAWWKVKRP